MKFNLGLSLLVIAAMTNFMGCSRNTDTSSVVPTSTTTTSTSFDTSSTSGTALPTNLFDTSTSGDTAGTGSLTPTTSTSTDQLCTTSDSIYGNFGSLTPASGSGYYCAGSTIDQSALQASAVASLNSLYACYQTVLSNTPPSTDAATVVKYIKLGGMAISRCTRAYVLSQQQFGQGYGGWSGYQASVYSADQNLLWVFLNAFRPR